MTFPPQLLLPFLFRLVIVIQKQCVGAIYFLIFYLSSSPMAFIPLDPADAQSLLSAFGDFPISFVAINNPGDYENENIVFKANKNISSLYDYILVYSIEDTETGLPEYAKCRILTFDSNIDLKKVLSSKSIPVKAKTPPLSTSKLTPFTKSSIGVFRKPSGISPHSSYELLKHGDSIGGGHC